MVGLAFRLRDARKQVRERGYDVAQPAKAHKQPQRLQEERPAQKVHAKDLALVCHYPQHGLDH